MAGPFTIQRIPRALLNLIGNYGGQTPPELAQQVIGNLDLLQMYGQTQLQTASAANAAAAENAGASLVMNANSWTVLFAVQQGITKTATLTALYTQIFLDRQAGLAMVIDGKAWGPFGATETGIIAEGWYAPYPILCPPGTSVAANAQIIGTDATVSISVRVEFGVLG